MVQTVRKLVIMSLAAASVSTGLLMALFAFTLMGNEIDVALLVIGIGFILFPLTGLHKAVLPNPDRPIPAERVRFHVVLNTGVSILGPLMFLYIFGRVAPVWWRSLSPPFRGGWATFVQPIGFTLGAILNAAVLVYIIATVLRSRREP